MDIDDYYDEIANAGPSTYTQGSWDKGMKKAGDEGIPQQSRKSNAKQTSVSLN